MKALKGLLSRPTKEEQEAVDRAAQDCAKRREGIGHSYVEGTNRLVSYTTESGGRVHDKPMMRVKAG